MWKVRGARLRLQTNLMKSCEGEGVYPAEQLNGVYSQRSRFPTFVVVLKKKVCEYSTVNFLANL